MNAANEVEVDLNDAEFDALRALVNLARNESIGSLSKLKLRVQQLGFLPRECGCCSIILE